MTPLCYICCMTETEEIDKLLESSRNAYIHEKDAKLSKAMRIGAMTEQELNNLYRLADQLAQVFY